MRILDLSSRRVVRSSLLVPRLWSAWRVGLARQRSRRALSLLDDHLRDDIGLSARDCADEAAKPFWQD